MQKALMSSRGLVPAGGMLAIVLLMWVLLPLVGAALRSGCCCGDCSNEWYWWKWFMNTGCMNAFV